MSSTQVGYVLHSEGDVKVVVTTFAKAYTRYAQALRSLVLSRDSVFSTLLQIYGEQINRLYHLRSCQQKNPGTVTIEVSEACERIVQLIGNQPFLLLFVKSRLRGWALLSHQRRPPEAYVKRHGRRICSGRKPTLSYGLRNGLRWVQLFVHKSVRRQGHGITLLKCAHELVDTTDVKVQPRVKKAPVLGLYVWDSQALVPFLKKAQLSGIRVIPLSWKFRGDDIYCCCRVVQPPPTPSSELEPEDEPNTRDRSCTVCASLVLHLPKSDRPWEYEWTTLSRFDPRIGPYMHTF